MDYQQKLYALNAIAETSLKMRKPGDWYVSQSVEIKDGSVLVGSYGNGITPEEAINDHWDILTSLPHGKYLIARAHRDDRKAIRWNGFMWETVNES